MKGLPTKIIQVVEKVIANQFDEFLVNFLGIIPKLNEKKRIVFTTSKNNLTSLFLQALGQKEPNKDEEEVLKTSLRIAAGYVDALKERTQAKTIQTLNAYAQEKQLQKEPIKPSEIKKLMFSEIDKSKNHLKLIANSESNRVRNIGTAIQITKVAEDLKVDRPVVFFVPTIDERNDPETYRLHLLPDRKTPRCWYLDELNTSYHVKGDNRTSILGTNPNCRCFLTFMSPGFGFDQQGNLKWIGLDHDELKYQREKFGKPS